MALAVRKLFSGACVSSVCTELKHILDMIQLESVELERVKVQHNQKLDQLEKSQETLLQVRPRSLNAKMSSSWFASIAQHAKKQPVLLLCYAIILFFHHLLFSRN